MKWPSWTIWFCPHGPWVTVAAPPHYRVEWLGRAGGAGNDPEALSWNPGTAKPIFSTGHRLEDNPGVRRHLVKKPSRTQGGRGSPSGLAPILRRKKKKQQLDRRPHEVPDPEEVGLWILLASPPPFSLPPCLAHRHVPRTAGPTWRPPGLHPWRPPQVFVELNELMLDRSQEPHWRETARWIKFEEDVEEETERWGKPHVASLSFRSLLELRRTIAHGRGPAGLSLELQALFTNHRAQPVLGFPAPGTAPWSPGARRGLAATLGTWGPAACTAISFEGWGCAQVPSTVPGAQ